MNVDFIGIGAPKCGTTWVSQILSEHPQVYLPQIKELKYFCLDDLFFNKFVIPPVGVRKNGPEWYKSMFKDASQDQRKGEFTPIYLYHESSSCAIEMNTLSPDVKIIIMLRNPADMIYATYYHLKSHNLLKSKFKSFEEILPRMSNDFLMLGCYHKFLSNFFEIFDRNNIFIGIFEEAVSSPESFIYKLYEFIDVNTAFIPPSLKKKINEAGLPYNSFFHQHIAKVYKLIYTQNLCGLSHFAANGLRCLMPIYKKLNWKRQSYPLMRPEVRKLLNQYYQNTILELGRMIDRPLTIWNK